MSVCYLAVSIPLKLNWYSTNINKPYKTKQNFQSHIIQVHLIDSFLLVWLLQRDISALNTYSSLPGFRSFYPYIFSLSDLTLWMACSAILRRLFTRLLLRRSISFEIVHIVHEIKTGQTLCIIVQYINNLDACILHTRSLSQLECEWCVVLALWENEFPSTRCPALVEWRKQQQQYWMFFSIFLFTVHTAHTHTFVALVNFFMRVFFLAAFECTRNIQNRNGLKHSDLFR